MTCKRCHWDVRPGELMWHEANCTRIRDSHAGALAAEFPHGKDYALRTRSDYDFRCQRCGAPHNIDTSIPSAIWNQIVERGGPDGDKYGALCTICIDDLLKAKGLTCEAEFYFVGDALRGRLYGPDAG